MNLGRVAEKFFHDSRLLSLIILLILVAGLSSLAVLPRMEDPVLARRVALINTRMPGADAKRVETLVTEKIENRLRDIEEIKELRSVSRIGISSVSVELRDDVTQTDTVWSRVRSRLDDALADLPPDAIRPEFEELEVRAYAMIVGLKWTGWGGQDDPDIRVLRRLAIVLQDELQNLPGTDSIDRFGDPGEEIEVQVDPARSAAMGITPGDIAERLASYDAKATAGVMRDGISQTLLKVGNQLDAIDQIESVPVSSFEGRDVRLGEIAEITIGVPNPPATAANLNGDEAVVLGAMVRPAYRIDRWTQAAEALIAEFESTLPVGIEIDFVLKQSEYVQARLKSLLSNLFLGALAVAGVIWLLMGFRSALIVTLTLPLASLMVLFALRVVGIPIHQMSITGLIIALGLLIDNAIVTVDEVKGRLRNGATPANAMSGSVSHLAIPLLGSTLTTALAFAPIALMPGPAGEFVGAIAISVIFAIFSSLFLAMTVIPTIAAKVLAKPSREEKTTFSGIRLRRFAFAFEGLVRHCVLHPWRGVAISLVLPLIGFAVFPLLDEQFFPASGRDQFHITIEGAPTDSLDHTRRAAQIVDRITRETGAERIDWFYGESAPQFYYNVIALRKGTPNFAQGLVKLPAGTDPQPVIHRLQDRLDREIRSSRVLVKQLEQGPPFSAPVEVRLFGPDLDVLQQLGDEVRLRLSRMPEVTSVRTDMTEVLPQISFDVDEASVVQAGVSPTQIAGQLAFSLEGRLGGNILQDNEELPIIVRVGGVDRGELAKIQSSDIQLTTAEGIRLTPLSAIAQTVLTPEAAALPRLNRMRMNEVAAYLQAGVLPSIVQSRLEAELSDWQQNLPTGYTMSYGGEASKRDDAVGNLFSTVGVLAVLMLATLVLSFSSFRMAGIITLVAALSVGLGMAALTASGYPFGFMAIIGTMGLIGVAINDSIVVLAGIRANPSAVAGDTEAVVGEVMHTSRHVVATTLTTMAGFTPLILDGGGFWPPMAVSIAGGVAGATLLALILVPSLHTLLMIHRSS
ncbi:efflux RND transporter permease subunit [Neorhodopirellula pilleata]|uniref:Nickel and cobalt resistance protein CnrA n=1 Tax=Neorhodopirellula pilleata TaxID=2714738 RepID=A0A5C5ZWH3_9BACT|nr:efflux RND transporter permease subunit [Neorhodopirellula pilleata]TWT91351.1 Nickel and cobalt resistance protein CnrA [Neorhodopirellula pilleata]